jgi:hypothetical protein
MILTRESAGQRIHMRTVLEYALESQSQSASVTVPLIKMHCRVRYLFDFDPKIRSGQVCPVKAMKLHSFVSCK